MSYRPQGYLLLGHGGKAPDCAVRVHRGTADVDVLAPGSLYNPLGKWTTRVCWASSRCSLDTMTWEALESLAPIRAVTFTS